MLRYQAIDVSALLQRLDVRLLGIDLHCMVHVQGRLAVASLLTSLRKDIPIVFGGISSTYYADLGAGALRELNSGLPDATCSGVYENHKTGSFDRKDRCLGKTRTE
jgi:hypothetical protein